MQETESIDEYILQHIDPESDYLKSLYRDTHVKLLRPRMASGHLQGRMLKMFVGMIQPRQILEIGTYSVFGLPISKIPFSTRIRSSKVIPGTMSPVCVVNSTGSP